MAMIPPASGEYNEFVQFGQIGFIARLNFRCASTRRRNIPLNFLAYLDGLHNSVVDNHGMGKPSDLVQGTLDLLILKAILLAPMHGWAIAKRIQQVSGEVLQVQQGSLYPALHRLEQQGWIKAKWAESEAGQPGEVLCLNRRRAQTA
jgi:PadR family transcriptional regulator PadR